MAENTAHEVLKRFDHKESLESYLERNRPSQINDTEADWIQVDFCDKERDPERSQRRDAMLEEWRSLLENQATQKITPETLRDLAVKYRITTGKWLIFTSSKKIDDLWHTIAEAVIKGKLGHSAKVSTKKTQDPKHVICVYTEDFTDETDVRRVEQALRELSMSFLQYKADVYTLLDNYKDNNLAILPCIYRSLAVMVVNDEEEEEEEEHAVWKIIFQKGHYHICQSKQAYEVLQHNVDMAQESFIVYDHEEPLENFLEENKPSVTNDTEAHWISVHVYDRERDPEKRPRINAMLAEWHSLLENQAIKKITPETIKELAIKCSIVSGKWLIFAGHAKIDDLWFTVAKGVVAGKLGHAAKVSTRNERPSHVICIYSKDFTDETDVRRVEKTLRDLEICCKLDYKPDIHTYLNIYKQSNDLGIPPFIYRSEALFARNGVYNHKEPLTCFLERSKPSQIDDDDINWINVSTKGHYDDIQSEQSEDSKHRVSAMRAEWHSLQENQAAKKITPETLRELAVKYRFTTGKWLIFTQRAQVNDLWFTVAKAVLAGKLGHAAKVSTKKAQDPKHVIWVYTEDFTDERDVRRVEKALRELHIDDFMQYKADVYTILNIYRGNELGIPPCVCRSEATRAQSHFAPRSHPRKNYDFSVLKKFTH